MQFNTPDSELRQFCSFLKMPITQPFIEVLASKAYLAAHASPETVCMYITPPETPSSALTSSPLPPIYSFIRDLIVGSRVQAATLFGTMVYMERLKPRLSQAFCSTPDAAYRVLMSCLILSGKYLNDAAPKNKHWSTYCRIYQVLELNSMENYSLSLLDFDLSVTCQEVLYQYNAFSHLPHSAAPLPYLSPLVSNFPNTPKSSVFPPALKTPLGCKFPNPDMPIGSYSRSPSTYTAPVLLSHAIPYPSPLNSAAWSGSSNHFPLSKPARISELSNSGSGLYRRRTSRRQMLASPSQLSHSVTSSFCNRTLTSMASMPRLNVDMYSNSENHSAPLSAPLLGYPGSYPFPTYTLRSNVPEVSMPSPTKLPLPSSAGLAGFDASFKLPPLIFPNPEEQSCQISSFIP